MMFSIKIVFDRRNKADDTTPGNLDVRITVERKSYFIGTGVRVLRKHWAGAVVVRPDADALNARLGIIVRRVNEKVNEFIEQRKPIDVNVIKNHIFDGTIAGTEKGQRMYDWFVQQVPQLKMKDSTRKRYWLLCDRLKEFGGLMAWSDLSVETIYEWDAWLHRTIMAQTKKDEDGRTGSVATIYNYHKSLKAVLNRAKKFGMIDTSPYERLTGVFSRGDEESVEYLSEDEMKLIMDLRPVAGSQMETVRDLFVFQMFTGLSYSDMMAFDITQYKEVAVDGPDGQKTKQWVNTGKRIKTGVPYVSVLLPPVVDVLERHGWRVPEMPNQKYNYLLKTMGMVIGIEGLHSHLARHTFATYMLSNDVKVQNVMRMLGHKNIKTTMRYAKVLAKDVYEDFEMVGEKLKGAAAESPGKGRRK